MILNKQREGQAFVRQKSKAIYQEITRLLTK